MDVSNEQMNLVCLRSMSSHDLTTLSLGLDIGHLYLRPNGAFISQGRRYFAFSIGLLEVYSGGLLHGAELPLVLSWLGNVQASITKLYRKSYFWLTLNL